MPRFGTAQPSPISPVFGMHLIYSHLRDTGGSETHFAAEHHFRCPAAHFRDPEPRGFGPEHSFCIDVCSFLADTSVWSFRGTLGSLRPTSQPNTTSGARQPIFGTPRGFGPRAFVLHYFLFNFGRYLCFIIPKNTAVSDAHFVAEQNLFFLPSKYLDILPSKYLDI